jgi:hypothetical protein
MDQAGEGAGGGAAGDGAAGGATGGAGGAASGDWRAALPEDLRSLPVFKDVKDVGSLAKQFADAQSFLGASIRIPGKDASAADLEAFHKKLVDRVPGLYYYPKDGDQQAMDALFTKMGRPAKGEEYEVVVPKDGVEIPGIRETAHKLGLSKSQVKELTSWYAEMQNKAAEEEAVTRATDMRKLDAEWGAAKQQKLDGIMGVLTKTGAPIEVVTAFQSGSVGAEVLRWFDGLVRAIGSEGGNLIKDRSGAANIPTPKEAELQIDEIMRRAEYRELSPLGDSLREKVNSLAKIAWPD